MCISTDVSISELFYSLISASAPKTAYQSGSRLFVFSDFIWKCFLHNLPACCHLAAFAPQQNSTNSLALAYLAFCILFWYTSLFSDFFFFFLSIISRPKSFFFKQTKNKEKQTSATPVCVFSFRGQTFSAVGNQSRVKCAASLEEDTQYGWQLTVQAMFMHVRSLFDRNSTKPSASKSLISEVWKFYLVLRGKKPLIFQFHHKNCRRFTAPNLLQFILSILFLFQLLLLEMTQMRKKKKEKV